MKKCLSLKKIYACIHSIWFLSLKQLKWNRKFFPRIFNDTGRHRLINTKSRRFKAIYNENLLEIQYFVWFCLVNVLNRAFVTDIVFKPSLTVFIHSKNGGVEMRNDKYGRSKNGDGTKSKEIIYNYEIDFYNSLVLPGPFGNP